MYGCVLCAYANGLMCKPKMAPGLKLELDRNDCKFIRYKERLQMWNITPATGE